MCVVRTEDCNFFVHFEGLFMDVRNLVFFHLCIIISCDNKVDKVEKNKLKSGHIVLILHRPNA